MSEQTNQATSNQRPKERDEKLTADEMEFAALYIKYCNAVEAVKHMSGLERLLGKTKAKNKINGIANAFMHNERARVEIKRLMDNVENKAVATASEVLEYFTSVMRGEVKDQFGLDAPLSERTKAAQELAKRTIDIENREAGKADQLVAIQLDWSRE